MQTAGWGRDKDGGGGCITDVGGKVVVDVSLMQREGWWSCCRCRRQGGCDCVTNAMSRR